MNKNFLERLSRSMNPWWCAMGFVAAMPIYRRRLTADRRQSAENGR